MTALSSLRSRFRMLYLAPVLAMIALSAWALASPIGSSPDDDFHLVSTWCASENTAAGCAAGTEAYNRDVAVGLLDAGCYNRDAEKSGACQSGVDFNVDNRELSQRGNFVGGYPPVFYKVMSVFAGGDIVVSALVMRLVSAAIFVALVTALFALLPLNRRPALVWTWLVTTVPLGMFLIASNNPSSWAITGVGTSWLALVGWFESTGRRKVGLGALFAVCTVVAAGARGDAAIYSILGIGVAALLCFAPNRRFWRDCILPAVLVIVCLLFFVTANQVLSGFNGFGGTATGVPGESRDMVGLFFYNLLNVPSLWAGVFGLWGLGWLEVGMPAVVAFGSLACFVGLAFVGFGRLDWRKTLSLAGLGASLILIPVVVLTRGGDIVGEQVQPRYLLPLIVLFAGVLLFTRTGASWRLTRGQTVLVALTLVATQFVALHTTMRRYITGTDVNGWNLNQGMEWWWNTSVSPMLVLGIGSLAFGAVVWIVIRSVSDAPPTAGVDHSTQGVMRS